MMLNIKVQRLKYYRNKKIKTEKLRNTNMLACTQSFVRRQQCTVYTVLCTKVCIHLLLFFICNYAIKVNLTLHIIGLRQFS